MIFKKNNVNTKFIKINNLNFYLASSSKLNKKAVIVYPEAYGLTGNIKDIAHRLARGNFDVFVLQIYYQQSEKSDFSIAYNDKEKRNLFLENINISQLKKDLSQAQEYFKKYEKIYSIGFSVGGYLSLLSSTIFDYNALFVYYPNPTINNNKYNNFIPTKNFIDNIKSEVFLFFGNNDHSISESEITEFQTKLKCKNTIIQYPESSHGFFCNSRRSYNKKDSEHSWSIVLNNLNK